MNKDNTVEMGIVTNGAKKYLSKNDEKFLKDIRENNTKSYGNEQFMQSILDNKSINMDKNKSIEEFDRLEKVDIIKFHTKSNGRIQEDYLEYKKDNMITNNLNIKKIFEMGYRENISKRNEKTEINTKKEGFFKKIKVKYIYTTYYFEREIIPVYLKIINNQSIKQEYICTGYYIENNGGHTYTEFGQKLFNKLGCTLEDDNNNYYLLKIEEKDFKIDKPKELGYVLDNVKFSNITKELREVLNIDISWDWQNRKLLIIKNSIIYDISSKLMEVLFKAELRNDLIVYDENGNITRIKNHDVGDGGITVGWGMYIKKEEFDDVSNKKVQIFNKYNINYKEIGAEIEIEKIKKAFSEINKEYLTPIVNIQIKEGARLTQQEFDAIYLISYLRPSALNKGKVLYNWAFNKYNNQDEVFNALVDEFKSGVSKNSWDKYQDGWKKRFKAAIKIYYDGDYNIKIY